MQRDHENTENGQSGMISESLPTRIRAAGLCRTSEMRLRWLVRPQTIRIQVEMAAFHAGADDLGALRCPNCDIPLDLHQPLADEPECLLGVCDQCHDLYLVNRIDDPSEAWSVMLLKLGNIPRWATSG
jgi:hypothetical protein